MQSLIYFIVALSLLIVVHEFGHFWVARRCGVKVLRFSVGFGKPIWKRVGNDGTEYVIAPIPLGGYVKMLDEREGTVPDELLPKSFNRKPLLSRTLIVAAGPTANLIFAVIAFWLLFVMGIPGIKPVIDFVAPDSIAKNAGLLAGDEITAINDKKTPTWRAVLQAIHPFSEQGGEVKIEVSSNGQPHSSVIKVPKIDLEQGQSLLERIGIEPFRPRLLPIIGEVSEGQAANKAGLISGDEILAVNGNEIHDWNAWVKVIQQNPDSTIEVIINRSGSEQIVTLTPNKSENGEGFIGAAISSEAIIIPDDLQAEIKYGPLAAVVQAVSKVWDFSASTLHSLWGMLKGTVSSKNLGGPITIAQIAGASAEQGIQSFINFLAMISITLGILNLLPIPVLDGGHLTMFLAEAIRGKPLSESLQIKCQRIGMILLLSLMMMAFFNDLSRVFG